MYHVCDCVYVILCVYVIVCVIVIVIVCMCLCVEGGLQEGLGMNITGSRREQG